MINREAMHATLDAALDTMIRLGEEGYVGLDINTYTVNLRVSIPRNAESWEFYEHYNPCEINNEKVKEIIRELDKLGAKTATYGEDWIKSMQGEGAAE